MVNGKHANTINENCIIRYFAAPIGKPRMTQRDKWKKRPCVVKYREWADGLRAAAKAPAFGELPPAHLVKEVRIVALFKPPKSLSKKQQNERLEEGYHRQKPDVDNIAKAVLDVLWEDDEKVPTVIVRKHWHTHEEMEITVVY